MTTPTPTTTETTVEPIAVAESKQATAIRYVLQYSKTLFELDGALRQDTRSGDIFIGDKSADIASAVVLARAHLGQIPEAVYTPKGGRPRVMDVTREDMKDAIKIVAGMNQFDPVTDYLTSLPAWDGVDRSAELLASLSVEDPKPLHRAMLRRTLIAAVARVYEPGCKVDTICVLHAPEGGEGKSTFWRKLFGGEAFFSDSKIDLENKDGMQKVDRYWIHEWSEMAALKSNASGETIKAFLSSARDDYRKPYAGAITSHRRRSLFVGTTNDGVVLRDNGGNRRFWIIPNVGDIDIGWVEQNQAQLLAQAVAEYRAGVPYWLTKEEERENAVDQRDQTHEAPGTDLVAKYIESKAEVTTAEIVKKYGIGTFCGLGLGSNRAAEMKVADILKRGMGWTSQRRGMGADRVRYYARPTSVESKVERSGGRSVFGVAKFN